MLPSNLRMECFCSAAIARGHSWYQWSLQIRVKRKETFDFAENTVLETFPSSCFPCRTGNENTDAVMTSICFLGDWGTVTEWFASDENARGVNVLYYNQYLCWYGSLVFSQHRLLMWPPRPCSSVLGEACQTDPPRHTHWYIRGW